MSLSNNELGPKKQPEATADAKSDGKDIKVLPADAKDKLNSADYGTTNTTKLEQAQRPGMGSDSTSAQTPDKGDITGQSLAKESGDLRDAFLDAKHQANKSKLKG